MSTFRGKILEISEICIDEFRNDKLNESKLIYFLSHCHTDHMQGMYNGSIYDKEINSDFVNHLKNNGKYLYVSKDTATILKNWFRSYDDWDSILNILNDNKRSEIQLKNDQKFWVTAIPANHCLGSVMFLFETEEMRALYTGDHRVDTKYLRNLEVFYDENGILKEIGRLYLDTTFFLKEYNNFITKNEIIQEMVNEMRLIHPKQKIVIKAGYNWGYEEILTKIYETFQEQICVPQSIFNVFSQIDELNEIVTTDEDAFFYFITINERVNIQGSYLQFFLSARPWNNSYIHDKGGFMFLNEWNEVEACYSTHASYQETLELIRFIKPENIKANVDYDNDSLKRDEIIENITKIIAELKES